MNMDGDSTFSVDQLSEILPTDNVDSWINHATWYDLECINHYDQQPPLDCVVQTPTLPQETQMLSPSSMTLVGRSPKQDPVEANSSCGSDFITGIQTILKSNNSYDSSSDSDLRGAVSVSHSGIMNGIFIPSNLIQQNIAPKEFKMDPVTVTISPPPPSPSNAKFTFEDEQKLIGFLKTQGGKSIIMQALGITETELEDLFLRNRMSDNSTPPKDFHCYGCRCKGQNIKGNISPQESALSLPSSDTMPRSPEFMKATSPDSSTAFSDHLSTSPFDSRNLAASPEIPIIKREIVDELDHNECNSIDSSPAHGGEKIRRHRGTYPKSLCLDVIEFVKQGFSARAAAKKFGIPKSTVHNWLHEDIATRPEKGHRKRSATNSTSSLDPPRPKIKPEMNELLPTCYSNSPNANAAFDGVDNYTNDHGKIVVRNRTSDSFSSEDTEARPDAMYSWKTSPLPGCSQEPQIACTESGVPNTNKCISIKVEGEDLSFDFDELLHIDDWIEQEEWYRQQYMKHYGSPYKLRKSYGSYSNVQRKEAVDFVLEGNSISTAARKFSIPKSTLHTWLSEESDSSTVTIELEQEILNKIEEVQKATGNMCLKLGNVKRIVQDVAGTHGTNFRASYAWCRDFVKRHSIFLLDSKENIERLCQEEATPSRPPSMVDFTAFLGLKPTNDTQNSVVCSSST